ncbi:hypothetical protein B0H63DRAFT_87694 [Podospora didyma]|uniref:Rhodopsin domain-containing protein n=1 Tax=Podospora didyma TaxID=330526 RepID=A0AAE0K0X7_9PEZI|nr:hypothetical protein B0H63DRAFT_87694 [Podospora didyma]
MSATLDLSKIPAMAPPEGYTSDPNNPSMNQATAYIAVAGVFMALTSFFVGVRLYARFFIQRSPWWDDFFVALALLCQAGYCGLAIWLSVHGVGKHMWDVWAADVLKLIEPGRAIGDITEPAVGFTKLALLLFYYRLFKANDTTRIGSLIGIAIVVPLYTTLFFLFIFLDIDGSWRANKAMAIMNIATDIGILILPLTAVVGLHLDKNKKIGLIALFSTGFFACVMSVVGAVYRFRAADDPDFTFVLSNVYLVNTIECCVGIMCACLPFFPALIKKSPISSDWLISLRSLRDRIMSSARGSSGARSHRSAKNNYVQYGDSKDAGSNVDVEMGHTGQATPTGPRRPPSAKSKNSPKHSTTVGLNTVDIIDAMPGLYKDELKGGVPRATVRMDPALTTQTQTRVGASGASSETEGIRSGGIEVSKGYVVRHDP